MSDLAKDYTVKKWFVSLKDIRLEKNEKPEKESYLGNILLCLVWIAFLILRGSNSLIEHGYFFLFSVDKKFIGEYEKVYSKSDLWHMSEGVWIIIGLVIWTYFLIKWSISHIKQKKSLKATNKSQQTGELNRI
jgi:uncharacterized membrane protein